MKFQPDYERFYRANINERLTDGDASEAGIIKFFESVEKIDISNEIISSYGKNFSDFLVRINRLNITFFNCLQNNKENICNALSK